MILFLAACITSGAIQNNYNRSNLSEYPVAYREVLGTWIGASIDDLMLRWGEPDKTFILSNGNTVYEYIPDYVELSSSRLSETAIGFFSSSSICISRFEIKDSAVVRVDTWGDYCSKWREPQKIIPKENSSHPQGVYVE